MEGEGPTVDIDREESPLPAESPPPPNTFCGLTIREQFAYVKPVMRAIIDNAYAPVRQRHKDFMNRKSRQSLRTQSGGIGDFSAKEFDQLGKVVQRWLLPQSANVQKLSTAPEANSNTSDRDDEDQFASAVNSAVLPPCWSEANIRSPGDRQ